MARPIKNKMLHVRSHLEHIQLWIELFNKHGMCPLAEDELKRISLINRALLKHADAKRAKGNRKDLDVEAS